MKHLMLGRLIILMLVIFSFQCCRNNSNSILVEWKGKYEDNELEISFLKDTVTINYVSAESKKKYPYVIKNDILFINGKQHSKLVLSGNSKSLEFQVLEKQLRRDIDLIYITKFRRRNNSK